MVLRPHSLHFSIFRFDEIVHTLQHVHVTLQSTDPDNYEHQIAESIQKHYLDRLKRMRIPQEAVKAYYTAAHSYPNPTTLERIEAARRAIQAIKQHP